MSRSKYTTVKSNGLLEQKSAAELLVIYQGLVPGDPPEFKTKEQLVRACILELAKKNKPGRRQVLTAKHIAKEPKDRKPWAFDATKLVPKTPRKGSKREKLVAMLLKGATFAEIQAALSWTYKQAFVQMRAVNTHNGYGFAEHNKRLIIFTYDEGPPE